MLTKEDRVLRVASLEDFDAKINNSKAIKTATSGLSEPPRWLVATYSGASEGFTKKDKWNARYAVSGADLAKILREKLVFVDCVSPDDGCVYWFIPYMEKDLPAVMYHGTDTMAMFRSACLGQNYVLYYYDTISGSYKRHKTTDEIVLARINRKEKAE